MFFVQMEVGLMKVGQRLSRSWIHDSYFRIQRPAVQLINEENVRGECPYRRLVKAE